MMAWTRSSGALAPAVMRRVLTPSNQEKSMWETSSTR